MPTGYTSKLVEEDQSFEDFALNCAMAFGTCIHQRDDDSTKPKLIDNSEESYYAKQAKAEYEKFKNMTTKQASILAKEEYDKNKKEYLKCIENAKIIRNRIKNMLAKVLAYVPPTEGHVNYRNFMIEQLEITLAHDGCFDYYTEKLKTLKLQTGEKYLKEKIKLSKENILYHTNKLEENARRNDGRNKWIMDLYNSLGVDYES